MPGADIICTVCEEGRSEAPNEIVLCDNCNHGYHQKCHKPKIPNKVLRPEVPWLCRKCVFATTARTGGAARKGVGAQALQAMKKILPYSLKSLTWDALHQRNKQECYCYCGGPGEWYIRMLQCRRCQQWFHEACLQCLDYPLLLGDHLFVFVCAVCNYGQEFIQRIDLTWSDIAHIVLFGLTLQHRKRFFDLDSEIIPCLNSCWTQLQLKNSVSSTNEKLRRTKLLKTFENNSPRFKCGSEIKKRSMLYALRVGQPPLPGTVQLPKLGMITAEIMRNIKIISEEQPIKQTHVKSITGFGDDETKIKSLTNGKQSTKGKRNDSKSLKEESTVSSCSSSRTSIYSINNKDKESSLSDSEDASSIGTLDSIIPKPNNFEGKNNPFRNMERRKKKCFSSSTATKRKPDLSLLHFTKRRAVSSRIEEEEGNCGLLLPATTTTPTTTTSEETVSENESLLEKRIVSPVTDTKIPLNDLKSSISSYFGAQQRIARGEKINVLAERVTNDGKIQYLIEWEGIS